MAKERIEEFNNLSIDDYVKELHSKRKEIIEAFGKAYLAETKLFPSEIELVCKETKTGNTIEAIFEFRRKQDGKNEGIDDRIGRTGSSSSKE